MIHLGFLCFFFLLLYIYLAPFLLYLQSPKSEFQTWPKSAAVFLFSGIAVE